MALTNRPPPGVKLFLGSERTLRFHQFLVLGLTFFAYAAFHASRKPPSIVKSVLTAPLNRTADSDQKSDGTETGWPPFDGPLGPHRLGELDLSFLLAYAVGMYLAGHIGDSFDLRIFLTIGMVGSSTFVILFGLGYFLDLHSFAFFFLVQTVCGLFQSIGWPCVLSIVGNWFGKSKRGLIMGVWNSHASVGNILGSVLASSALGFGWGWSFILPGILLLIMAGIVFLFTATHPDIVELKLPEKDADTNAEADPLVVAPVETREAESDTNAEAEAEADPLVANPVETSEAESGNNAPSPTAIGFLAAWMRPNVATYAFCLFFSKLVAYTFLYWLPFYIRQTPVAGVYLSHKTAGILSTIFDIGGVVGGISAGFISDKLEESYGVTSITFLCLSIPALACYRLYGDRSMAANLVLMFASGLLVNGPYSLIVTAVSTELGTQGDNSRAIATVSAIIDGTGSLGAALGPLLAGYISTRGWNSVFVMLIVSIFFAAFLLVRVVVEEVRVKLEQGRWSWCSFAEGWF